MSSGLGVNRLRRGRRPVAGVAWMVKHCCDRIAALLLIVILLPVLLAAAVAIKVEDRGPVLTRQTRVGRHGREFQMLRFRSTPVDAGPGSTASGVGARLRRYSLDELPQLFNVLSGVMALVGPRPPRPDDEARCGFDARRRPLVKPGLTGTWQISGRSDLSWDESVRLDLHYVENWSPALDLLILRRTLGAVLGGRAVATDRHGRKMNGSSP